MADHLAAVAKEVTALPRRPAGVLINGDCALKNGQAGDYATLGDLLRPLRVAELPLHLTLGNHDHRARFLAAFGGDKAGRPVASRHVAVVESPRANFVLLDTLDVTDGTPGQLGAEQLAWLANALDARPDKPAVVVGHHNPEAQVPAGRQPGGLLDTAALFKVLEPRKQVKAYVFGHTHVWEVKEHASGIHLVNLPAVAYVFAADQPSGWVHLGLTQTGARLELHSLDRGHKAQGQVVELAWRRG
jgi:3',5'-cyclic AMP phosphodiesterase CpdA